MQLAVVRGVAVVLGLVMAVSIAVGFATADFGADGRALVELTWGVITLVDIYVAFTFVWLWVAWREASLGRAVLWAVLIAVLGSLAIATYVATAAIRSSTIPELLLGPRRARPES